MKRIYTVGIVGGGVSGAVIAANLSENGIDNILFEKENSLVNGPPFCHLHAGGNLYPDISEEQCKILMRQSIEMARLFPQSIDERPTFISIPKGEDKYEVNQIEKRLENLVRYYNELIAEDPANEVLGNPDDYYKIYTEAKINALAQRPSVKNPVTSDEWMTNAVKLVDTDKLKMPVTLVQEYGWNLFRLGAQAQLALQQTENCHLKLNTQVQNIKDVRHLHLNYNWEITTNESTYKVKFLVNSSGFKTGEIDDALQINTERLIEFKAAYVAKWHPIEGAIPELIFHGERGTPHGMAQLTPYCDDYYQIHGMTEDITLFKEGLVKSKENKAQPQFDTEIDKKLTLGWSTTDTNIRTEKAVEFVANFVPTFHNASVGAPPLFGAQQIPGNDPTLRVGEVCFPTKSYARSEIVKASSALTVAHQIIAKMQEEGIILDSFSDTTFKENELLNNVSVNQIDELAWEFAVKRGFPGAMSKLLVDKKINLKSLELSVLSF